MSSPSPLNETFAEVDTALLALEARLAHAETLPLSATVDEALALIKTLLHGYLAARAVHAPGSPVAEAEAEARNDDDVLELFKRFVKGDPSLNAVRDNIREVVYYRNCIAMQREDALPAKPAAMAVRTVRHIYLYLRTRALKEQWLAE